VSGSFIILVVIVLVVASVLDSIRKAGQGTRVPPGARVPRAPLPRPPVRSRTGAGGERAEALVPDDLWAILTGEQRIPATPSRRSRMESPAPESGSTSAFDLAAAGTDPARDADVGAGYAIPEPAGAAWGTALAPSPTSPVSASPSTPAAAVQADAPPRTGLDAAAPASALRATLGGRDALRRAVVLQVVLGPPKSLE
jgi:hypothetical protein